MIGCTTIILYSHLQDARQGATVTFSFLNASKLIRPLLKQLNGSLYKYQKALKSQSEKLTLFLTT